MISSCQEKCDENVHYIENIMYSANRKYKISRTENVSHSTVHPVKANCYQPCFPDHEYFMFFRENSMNFSWNLIMKFHGMILVLTMKYHENTGTVYCPMQFHIEKKRPRKFVKNLDHIISWKAMKYALKYHDQMLQETG